MSHHRSVRFVSGCSWTSGSKPVCSAWGLSKVFPSCLVQTDIATADVADYRCLPAAAGLAQPHCAGPSAGSRTDVKCRNGRHSNVKALAKNWIIRYRRTGVRVPATRGPAQRRHMARAAGCGRIGARCSQNVNIVGTPSCTGEGRSWRLSASPASIVRTSSHAP